MTTTAEILNQAADLLSKPGAWTQATIARNSNGRSVDADSPDATCWCMGGGLVKVSGGATPEYRRARELLTDFLDTVPAHYNDAPGRTQAEVVAALRAAALSVGGA